MKRFMLIILMSISFIFASCATVSYANMRTVNEMDEVSYVLANYYPQLHSYYMDGVLDVTSLKEVVLEDGTLDYRIKYRFVRYYFRDHASRLEILQVHFPAIYDMYVSGLVEITSLYRYVEKNSGIVKYHCSYRRIYDYYYHYYPRLGGSHIYYRARPVPPRPRPEPRHEPRPNNRPRPEARPNNPPRQEPRPNNPPRTQPSNPRQSNPGVQPSRPQGGSQGGSRPSNPPRGNSGGNRGRR